MPTRIRTLLVDDQMLFREAIRIVLSLAYDINVVGEASDGNEALELVGSTSPDVVLMDLRMPHMGGIEATRRIRTQYPRVRVLILTTFDEEDDVLDALRAGASGYVLKNSPADQLTNAIQVVARGETYLQPSVASQVVAELNRLSFTATRVEKNRLLVAKLSQRECEILRLLVRGLSNKEIAAELSLTEGTVKNHMSGIFHKLGVEDRTAAALKARDLGFN